MNSIKSVILTMLVTLALLAGNRAEAKSFSCVPLEVQENTNLAQVLCAAPSKFRGGYPIDTHHTITYFAVPMNNPIFAKRFIQLANIAITAGFTLRFSYTSGDYSGESFGCNRGNCRSPWSFGIEKRASIQ